MFNFKRIWFLFQAHLYMDHLIDTKWTVGLIHFSIKTGKFPILWQYVAMEIPDVHGKELEEVKYTGNWIACFNMIHTSTCDVRYPSDLNADLYNSAKCTEIWQNPLRVMFSDIRMNLR